MKFIITLITGSEKSCSGKKWTGLPNALLKGDDRGLYYTPDNATFISYFFQI